MTLATAALSLVALTSGNAASPTDLCDFKPVFVGDFHDLSISSRHLNENRWTAHTPWNGDFGDATFADPGPDGPFASRVGR